MSNATIGLQVACDCLDRPTGMDIIQAWQGDPVGGFTEGRRIVFLCPECEKSVCVNLQFVDEDLGIDKEEYA